MRMSNFSPWRAGAILDPIKNPRRRGLRENADKSVSCLAGGTGFESVTFKFRPGGRLKGRTICGPSYRMRERDSNWLVWKPLLDQVNRRSDFVLRYEVCGEKCILQPYREQLRRPAKFSRTKPRAKSAGFWRLSQPTVRRANLWWRRECPPINGK